MTPSGPVFRQAALEHHALAAPNGHPAEVTAIAVGALSGNPGERLALLWAAVRSRRDSRARTPTRLQMEAAECGAVALGIVLAYFGRHVSIEALRLACGVSRDGSNALNLVRAARSYGLEARGLRRETLDQLLALPRPAILFWESNHFVVFEGAQGRRVFINDPATGPRTVTLDAFDRAFTGVILQMTPGPAFRRGGREPSLLRALAGRLAGTRQALPAVIVVSLLLLAPGVLTPLFLRLFVDEILVAGRGWLAPLLAGMALALTARALLTWMQWRLLLRLETDLTVNAARGFMRHVLSLPLGFFDQRSTGDIAWRVGLNERLAQVLSADLVSGAVNLALFVIYALLMLQYDAGLTAISLGLALASLVVLRDVARRQEDAARLLLQERGAAAGATISAFQAIETIKAGGGEDEAFARLSALHARVVTGEQRLRRDGYLLSSLPVSLLTLNAALVLVLGGEQVLRGQMTTGMLVAFQSLLMSVSGPLNQLVGLLARLRETSADLARLDDVLAMPPEPDVSFESAPTPEAHDSPAGRLALRDIVFGYSPLEPPLLDGVSLTLEPGRWVALVGLTGSGKSTLARLAAGLIRPWQGDVLLDGRPRSIAVVDQTINLFSGTLRDNLTLWNADISDETLREAARDACIDQRITALPDDYEARVEENGRNFSGGERQRLEIARALATNPRLLILDEATSALDAETERRVLANLRRRGGAVLLVAHRLTAVRACDEVIVLDRGRIVERGTHEQLLCHGGLYARLAAAGQSETREPALVGARP